MTTLRTCAAAVAALALLALTACGNADRPTLATTKQESALDPDQALTTAKLRTYCRACHAIGSQRFIWSESDTELWTYLHTNDAPISGKRWAVAIGDVLAWPTDSAPPPDEVMDPGGNRDWMPKGMKRLQLADDRTPGGLVTRRVMLDTLRK